MSELKLIAVEPPTSGKFIALYGDGSGGDVFMFDDSRNMIAADGVQTPIDGAEYLLDANYCYWLPLPDSYKLWCEQ